MSYFPEIIFFAILWIWIQHSSSLSIPPLQSQVVSPASLFNIFSFSVFFFSSKFLPCSAKTLHLLITYVNVFIKSLLRSQPIDYTNKGVILLFYIPSHACAVDPCLCLRDELSPPRLWVGEHTILEWIVNSSDGWRTRIASLNSASASLLCTQSGEIWT